MRRLRPQTIYLTYSVGEGLLFHMMSVLFSVFLIVDLEQAGSLVGIAAGVTIASFTTLRAPLLICGAGFVVLGVFMALAMREEGFRPERREGERLHTSFATTVREGVRVVRAHHVLALILATAALHGASTEGSNG